MPRRSRISATSRDSAAFGLAWFSRLYEIEREAKKQVGEAIERLSQGPPLDAVERVAAEQRLVEEITHKLRQEQSRPVVEKFGEWLETAAGQVLQRNPRIEPPRTPVRLPTRGKR